MNIKNIFGRVLTYIVTKKVVELTGDVLTLQINLYQL